MIRAEYSAETDSLSRRLRDDGYALTPPTVAPDVLDALASVLTPLLQAEGERGGVRHLLDLPSVQELARSHPVRIVAEAALGPGCFAVRGILFDKTPAANWKVVWHQDITIAVRERREVVGFGPWSEKDGVPHVQPPISLLERMVAVRVHLDDCGPENGPVRVIPRSHRVGRLSPDAVDAWKEGHDALDCVVPRGGILAFRPLTLHASSAATEPAHRRVVHLEFAADALPGGLTWYHQI